MSSSKYEDFLGKVTSRVRSKDAHGMIRKELMNHLQELSSTYQKGEATKEEAEERAIKEMGNPFSLGDSLNRLHRPRMDWVLISLFAIIAGISFLPLVGGVPEWSAPASFYMWRQGIWYGLGVLVMIGFLFFDYRKLRKLWPLFYGTALFLLLYTLFLGTQINGMQRWIHLGDGARIDVTSFALFLFFLAWAGIFSQVNEFSTWKKQVGLFLLIWAPILTYMMLPHMMFSIIYFFTVVGMFVVSGVKKKLALRLVVVNVAAGVILFTSWMLTSRGYYLMNRLMGFLDPYADPYGIGYLYIVVREALMEAGWFGNGFNNDLTSNRFPVALAHTDFAFHYLVSSLGWLFGIFLCVLLLLFIGRISFTAFKTKDHFGKILVLGGATLFAVPALWNILMGLGLVPIMGVSLPFISYGGGMLMFYSATLGLILNVYRRKDIVEPTIVKTE